MKSSTVTYPESSIGASSMQFSVADARRTYRNPVYDGYFADPFVLRSGGPLRRVRNRLGGRRGGLRSSGVDRPGQLDLGSAGRWSRSTTELGADYWAPEVVEADGRFWMYYSVGHGDAGHHLRVAVADHP